MGVTPSAWGRDEDQHSGVIFGITFESGLLGRSGHSPVGGRTFQMQGTAEQYPECRRPGSMSWHGLLRGEPEGTGQRPGGNHTTVAACRAFLLHLSL